VIAARSEEVTGDQPIARLGPRDHVVVERADRARLDAQVAGTAVGQLPRVADGRGVVAIYRAIQEDHVQLAVEAKAPREEQRVLADRAEPRGRRHFLQ
jgi:hypothetical protein